MNMLSMSGGGDYVGRYELATIATPESTPTWKPVPHIDVVNLLTDMLRLRGYHIADEQFGLSSEGQKMFGVMKIGNSHTPEWSRCIGIRNSHDKSLSVGLTAGLIVTVCSNLMFGGTMVIKRRHSSGIMLAKLIDMAIGTLDSEFETLELMPEQMKMRRISDNEARHSIVRAAEEDAIPSCDILPVFFNYKNPKHKEFSEPTSWSLLNAFTENAKKYSPARADRCHRKLTHLFGLNGQKPVLWEA